MRDGKLKYFLSPRLLILLLIAIVPVHTYTTHPATRVVKSQNYFHSQATTNNDDNQPLRVPHIQGNRTSIILVDVENLRGKAGFRLNHIELVAALSKWMSLGKVPGSSPSQHTRSDALLVVDHGDKPTVVWLPQERMAVQFAGRSRKADDVLVQDVIPYCSELICSRVILVTADRELIQRCRRAVSSVNQQIQILSPEKLVQEINSIWLDMSQVKEDMDDDDNGEGCPSILIGKVENELEMLTADERDQMKSATQLLHLQSIQYGWSAPRNNKCRKKLKHQCKKLRNTLLQRNSALYQFVLDTASGLSCHTSHSDTLPLHLQEMVLFQWSRIRRRSRGNRSEQTGDRVIMAERFRQQLLCNHQQWLNEVISSQLKADPSTHSLALSYVLHKNGVAFPNQLQRSTKHSLTLIVISDTHGMESSLPLPRCSNVLPPGDVLLHLGDFSPEERLRDSYTRTLDEWLARQPHSIKIILRGNHDPRFFELPYSGAICVTQPKMVEIHGFRFYLVPYTSSTMRSRALPESCDVVVSHVPPRGIRDEVRNHLGGGGGVKRREANVGCRNLRRAVERMSSGDRGPPALWLCGHIHEGRGSSRHTFGYDGDDHETTTLIVNAANANPGLATHLPHGPTVVALVRDQLQKVQATVLQQ